MSLLHLIAGCLSVWAFLSVGGNVSLPHLLHPYGGQDRLEDGVVTGRLSLPAEQRPARRFRGAAYRNRLEQVGHSHGAKPEPEGAAFLDVIVAARPLSFKAPRYLPERPARIDQREATFIPHVMPVRVGSIVEFVNNDPFFHNVFSLTPGARFNIGRRPTGDVVARRITYVEVTGLGEIKLFCDIHPQMSAIILSLDTPYFTRGTAEGNFRIGALPPGQYELVAYHPEYGTRRRVTRIGDGENVSWDIDFAH